MEAVNKMCPFDEVDAEALRQLQSYDQPVKYAWVDSSGVSYSFKGTLVA